jgi:hypothetical protein
MLSIAAIASISLVHLAILFSARLLPFVDIPNHLAMATIAREYLADSNAFSQYYALDLFPKPNVLFLFFCASPIVPSVEVGAKALVALYIVLVPLSVVMLVRCVGGSTWFAIAACLLLYNFNLIWGFVGYTISIPFVAIATWLTMEHVASDSRLRGIILSAVLALLFFMHALSLLLAVGVVLFSVAWVYRRDGRRLLHKCWVLLPALVLLLGWQVNESMSEGGVSKITFLPYYYKTQYLASWSKRMQFFTQDFRDITGGGVAKWGGAAISGSIVILGLAGACFARRCLSEARVVPALILGLLSLGGYLLFPERFPGYHFLFERLSIPLFLALIVLGSLAEGKAYRRVVGALAVAASLWYVSLVAALHQDFKNDSADFTRDLFPSAIGDTKIGGLIFEPYFRGHAYYIHFLDYFIVWRRGIATTRVIDAKSFPVERKVSQDVLPKYHEWVGWWLTSDEFRADYYIGMDYLLVKGDVPDKGRSLLEGFEVDRERGDWRLYRRIHR